MLEAETEALDDILGRLFGYHMVQLGCPAENDYLGSARIGHVIRLDNVCSDASRMAGLIGRVESLPFQSDSVDVVVLPHTLDLSEDPHSVLREIDRILIPEGHVVVIGFNPWSPWGPGRVLKTARRRREDGIHAKSALAIQDWLKLLGFEIIHLRHFFYRPLFSGDALMGRLQFMEWLGERCFAKMGSCYILVARKKVTTLTPIRPKWRVPGSLLGKGVIESAGRVGMCPGNREKTTK